MIDVKKTVAEVEADLPRPQFRRTLADVKPLVPEEEDPNVLFRHNWLARGQAVQLTASSGVGKSSMTMQAALHWAAGMDFLAEPMRPLKCAVIQAEDSERDVAEQIDGMRRGLICSGWTRDKFDEVLKKVYCPNCFIGKQGDAFIKMLREFQCDTKCDMLFINPVQAFFGGDISAQEDVSHWARGGIDPIIKSPDYGCGVMIVTHTTKFSSGETKGRANVDDYGEYIGAGSHEWLDWVRAKFVFLKHGKSEVYFDFKAAKRGARLGWTDEDDEKTTNKVFKHTDGYIFWQEVTDPDELARLDVKTETKRKVISEEEASEIASRMVEWIRKNRAVTKTELSELNDSAFKGMGLNRKQLRAGGSVIKLHYADVYKMQYTRDGYGFAAGLAIIDKQREQQRRIDQMNDAAREEDMKRKRQQKGLGSGRLDDLPPMPPEEAKTPQSTPAQANGAVQKDAAKATKPSSTVTFEQNQHEKQEVKDDEDGMPW